MENELINLAPKKKKGLLRIVFSRVGIVVLLMWVQLNIILSVYSWFAEYFKLFALVQVVFSLGMIFYLFNCDMDSSAKLTWLNLIMLFPVPATIMLWYTKKDIGHRVTKWRIAQLIALSREKISQDEVTIAKSELVESGTDDLCRYLCRTGSFPIFENTQVPDKKAAYALAKTHYRSFTKAGVKIYEYTPGFVHAKVFVSDDEKAVVGTINLDYRSLYHHFECATYLFQTGCITQIEDDFESTLAKCREVTAETIKKEKLRMKMLGGFMKLIAPLM